MTFQLQLLHASDLEGGVEAIQNAPNFAAIANFFERTFDPDFGGTLIVSAGDNYIPGPFFSAGASVEPTLASVFERFYGLPEGTLSQLEADAGRVDIAIMNLIGFDASAIGNHEFDVGTASLALGNSQTIVGIEFDFGNFNGGNGQGLGADPVNGFEWFGAQFPYLSANLDFSLDEAGNNFTTDLRNTSSFITNPSSQDFIDNAVNTPEKLVPSAIATVDGEDIGLIGLTTPTLESVTSAGFVDVIGPEGSNGAILGDPALLQDIADLVNAEVARLQAEGVNKIILTSHLQQFSFEQALAPLLNGVDIIIAGGSDTILLDETDAAFPGTEADLDDYPFLTANADGDPLAIVSTDGEYRYVGRLVAEFDDAGVLLPGSIDPTVSGSFETSNAGTLATVTDGSASQGADGLVFAEDGVADLVSELTNAVLDVVIEQDSEILAESEVFLEGRRTQVRTEETNLANAIGDAQIFYARQFDPTVLISIQNGGGLRAEIGSIINDIETGQTTLGVTEANPLSGKEEGEISVLDVNNTLRFDNDLVIVTLTVEGVLAQLENGVAESSVDFGAGGDTPGQFAQVSGLQFAFDPSLPAGERVTDVSVVDQDGTVIDVLLRDGEIIGDPSRGFRVVTNSFIFGGGDDYTFEDFADADPEFANVVNLADDTDGSFDPGLVDATSTGGQQDAFAEFLAFLAAEGTPFNQAETPVEQDFRIVNLAVRGEGANTVSQGTSVFRTYDLSDAQHNVFTSAANLLAAAEGEDDFVFEGLLFEGALASETGATQILAFIHEPSGSTRLAVAGDEADALIADGDFTEVEGFDLFAFTDDAADRIEVYEFLNEATGGFIYVANETERDLLEADANFTLLETSFFAFAQSSNVGIFINDDDVLTPTDFGLQDNPFTEASELIDGATTYDLDNLGGGASTVADMSDDVLI